MDHVKVLDCTLRDGGYCNQWQFGFNNAKKITSGLLEAGLDIIECGFLTEKVLYDPDVTKFNTVLQANAILPEGRQGKLFVIMMNYGEFDVDYMPERTESCIDGIRLAFHKRNLKEALEVGKKIQEKGYMLFIQAMVSLSYSDEDFLALIRECNEIKPYAFYIVDSFGVMKKKDLIRLFYMVEHNLDRDIAIGYHSHNNIQLAYSNAQALIDTRTKHTLIIDSSIYGMGRGAGNLNTELFLGYLNDNLGTSYKLKPLLNIIDEILDDFYKKNYWGYSLPNYLSASYNTHPNYAVFLNDKHTLTVEEMDEIFSIMDDDKRVCFDREYIERLYLQFLSVGEVQEQHKAELEDNVKEKKLLLIAPGKSSYDEREKIIKFSKREDVVSVSINCEYAYGSTDYIFLSNLRRFREFNANTKSKCIVTSNIPADQVYLQTNYKDLLNSHEMVRDNAGMMAIKFFINCGVKEVYLAGLDGYSYDVNKNYSNDKMTFIMKNVIVDSMNSGMIEALDEFARTISIYFLTEPKYVGLKKV